jgi:DNA polymerase-3 subunit delta
MQLRADQLSAHLAKGLHPLYTVFGDEPLLAQEAGDAIRAAARAAGYSERKVFTKMTFRIRRVVTCAPGHR